MPDTAQLVKLAKKGDQAAFAELYGQIYQDLYRFAYYVLKHPEDAEDAVADTVADAYQGISSLKKPEAFRGWMFKILSAKCKRKMKSYVDIRETEQVLIDNSTGADDGLIQSAELKQAFQSLSDEERMIVSLNVFGGYDSKEIADIMGLNRNTVRSKQSRALLKMKAILGENSDHTKGE